MIILYFIMAYLAGGIIFAIPFLVKWIHVLDEATDESPWTFKLNILPGCIVFWPVLWQRYRSQIKREGNHG